MLHVAVVSSAAAAVACAAAATLLATFHAAGSYDAYASVAASDVAAAEGVAAVAAAVAGHAADAAAAGGDVAAAAAAGGRGWAGLLPSPCLGHVYYPHTYRRSHVCKYLLPILKAEMTRRFQH